MVAAAARELIPYISDAVPGWFQATLALYDAKGKEVGYADDYRFHPDPVLYYEIPADGDYSLEIKDSIYRGREDFVYRITVGELPFVTGIFPLGGNAARSQPGNERLESAGAPAHTRAGDRGCIPGFGAQGRMGFQPRAVRRGHAAGDDGKGRRTTSRRTRSDQLPVIVNGRIGEPGDSDVFRFEGRAGEEIVAEVFARRLDSPLDSILKLTDAGGPDWH